MARRFTTVGRSCAPACCSRACRAGAQAQSVADFYRGKTVNVLIGVGVGGEYDLQARLVARHIGKHIPGNPTVVPQNMTGAGGIKMANYLFTQAPRDGTYIGMLGNNFAATQAVGGQGVQFDVASSAGSAPSRRWSRPWRSGTPPASRRSRTCARRRSSPAPRASGAITYIYPSMMNEFLGTKFKIVTGYAGGNEINLAMERGEVQARNNTWSSWKATKPAWLKDKQDQRHRAGRTAGARPRRALGRGARPHAGRAQADRAGRLRHAARPPDGDHARRAGGPARGAARGLSRHDGRPGFPRRGRDLNFEVAPVYGEDMQKIVGEVMSTPKELAARAKHLLE